MTMFLFVASAFLTAASVVAAHNNHAETQFSARIQSPREQFLAIKREYDAAMRSFLVKYRAAEGEEEKKRVGRSYPKLDPYAPRMLRLAEEFPSDPVAFDALLWIANNNTGGVEMRKLGEKVTAIFVKDHLRNKKMGLVCMRPGLARDPLAFVRKVAEKSPHHEVRGTAIYSLARMLKDKADTIVGFRQLKRLDPDGYDKRIAAVEKAGGKKFLRELIDTDPTELYKEAERFFGQVIKKYGGILQGKRKLADMAASSLYEMRNLSIGKTAPNIKGDDVDGVPFELGDFRGRVVVLVFSGNWCAPCRAMYPHERKLVKRLQDKPFVLLGISSDRTRETLKEAKKKGRITWRSWWDGGGISGGPIATKWNVKAWPKIYVLDRQGIIRYKGHEGLQGRSLDKAVDDLLGEGKREKADGDSVRKTEDNKR